MQRMSLKKAALSTCIATLACLQVNGQTTEPGGARVDIYTETGGGVAVNDLRNSAKYPAAPDRVEFVTAFEYPPGAEDGTPPAPDVENNYGWVISGNLIPK